jgi:hypothetical protein
LKIWLKGELDGIIVKFDGINSFFDGIKPKLDGISSQLDGINLKNKQKEGQIIHFIPLPLYSYTVYRWYNRDY